MGLFIILIAAVAVVGLRRPGVLIGFTFCIFGLQQALRAHSDWLAAHYMLINYCDGGLNLLGIAAAFARQRLTLRSMPRVAWFVYGLLLYALLSWFWSVSRQDTLERYALAAPSLTAIAILMPLVICKARDLQDAVYTVLILGCPVLLSMLGANWTGRSLEFDTWAAAGQAAGNPLAVASVAGYIAIAATLMNYRGLARIWQPLRWAIVILAILIIFKSASRGQLFACLLAVIALLPVSRRLSKASGLVGTAVGLFLLSLVASVLFAHVAALQGGRWDWTTMFQTYEGGRVDTSLTVLKAWVHAGPLRWLIGLGSSGSFAVIGFYPHMVPAEVLAELGLVGAGLYGAVLYLTIRSLRRMWPRFADFPEARGILAVWGAIFVFEFILGCKQGSMIGQPFFFAAVILIGRLERMVGTTQPARQEVPTQMAKLPGERHQTVGASLR